jgi:hypothetical protein
MRTLTDGEREILAELNAEWDADLAEPTPDELAAIEALVETAEAAVFDLDAPEPWQLAPDQEPF